MTLDRLVQAKHLQLDDVVLQCNQIQLPLTNAYRLKSYVSLLTRKLDRPPSPSLSSLAPSAEWYAQSLSFPIGIEASLIGGPGNVSLTYIVLSLILLRLFLHLVVI
jgi:hypothetical protein